VRAAQQPIHFIHPQNAWRNRAGRGEGSERNGGM
jgi:hypothetical protein